MNSIYADFMKTDREGRLVLSSCGTFDDLDRLNLELKPGLRLVFYNDDKNNSGNREDLIAEGILDYDQGEGTWVATIDRDSIKNVSKLSSAERTRFGLSVNSDVTR